MAVAVAAAAAVLLEGASANASDGGTCHWKDDVDDGMHTSGSATVGAAVMGRTAAKEDEGEGATAAVVVAVGAC